MVTLSSVGYGSQYYPRSLTEMVLAILLFFFGSLVFVRFLDTFSDLFTKIYVAEEDETRLEELTHWTK
jgi:hypothetical protein